MGDSEIRYFDLRVILGPEKIGRLDVSVDDPLMVNCWFLRNGVQTPAYRLEQGAETYDILNQEEHL